MILAYAIIALCLLCLGFIVGATFVIWILRTKRERIERNQRELDEVFCIKNRKHFPP